MDIGSQEELEQQDQLVVTVVVALEVVEVVDVKETDQMTLAVAEEAGEMVNAAIDHPGKSACKIRNQT